MATRRCLFHPSQHTIISQQSLLNPKHSGGQHIPARALYTNGDDHHLFHPAMIDTHSHTPAVAKYLQSVPSSFRSGFYPHLHVWALPSHGDEHPSSAALFGTPASPDILQSLATTPGIPPAFFNCPHSTPHQRTNQDRDDTLKRKTFELLYKMTKSSNVEVIVDRMIGYMITINESHYKMEIASRCVELAEQFSLSNPWFIQTMNRVFEHAGDLVNAKVSHNLMRLIAEGFGEDDAAADSRLRSSAVESYLWIMGEPKLPSSFLQLGIRPFSYGLIVISVYDNGSVFSPEVLDLTEDDLVEKFALGVSMVTSLELAISYPTLAAAPHMFINGYKNVLAVALETDYSFPQADKVEYLADPTKFAVVAAPVAAVESGSAPAAKVEEKKDEPEKESDEDMGLGLFD